MLPAKSAQILVFALGGPGSGKGSVCHRLTRLYHPTITTVSVGELLRKDPSVEIQRTLKRGALVPPEYSAALLHSHLPTVPASSYILIVDGFPRDVAAARIWDKLYASASDRTNALFFDAPDAVLRRRLLGRGRADDKSEVIERRLDFHRENTPPLWDYMHSQGRAASIDATGSFEDVAQLALLALLDAPFNLESLKP